MRKQITQALLLILMFAGLDVRADILLHETFSSSTLPAGWSTGLIAGSQHWTFRSVPAFGSLSGGFYAVFDDAALGAAVTPNHATLTTPVLNCVGRTNTKLRFHHFWDAVENTFAYVEISNDGGSFWTTLQTYSLITQGSLATAAMVELDISAYADGQSDVRVRFRYNDGSQAGKFWYVDDIMVYAGPDVGVEALIAPSYLACNTYYGAAQSVTIRVRNYTPNPISAIPVSCEVLGGITTTLSGTVPGPIAGFGFVDYTFPSTINMTADAVYHFIATTNLVGDSYAANNEHKDGRRQFVTTYPFVEPFTITNSGWLAGKTVATSDTRNFIWGETPYLGGPEGNGTSWYLDVQTNGSLGEPWVVSPTFNFTSLVSPNLRIDLKYQLGLSSYNHLIVEYTTNDGITWTRLGTSTDPIWYNSTSNGWGNNATAPVDDWTTYQRNLCFLAGQPCVKFRVRTQSLWYSGTNAQAAFDNFTIQEQSDVALVAFVPIDLSCSLSPTQTLSITAHNFSCNPVLNVPVTCQITGATTATLVGTIPSIPAASTITYTFPTTFDMTALGTYHFTAFHTYVPDVWTANDTIVQSLPISDVKISTFPYIQDFNASTGNWVAKKTTATSTSRNFVHGLVPYLGGDDGMDRSWFSEVTANGSLGEIWVESPVFDFSLLNNPRLSFDIKHRLGVGTSYNRVRVDYSLNGGATWTQLGTGPLTDWYSTSAGWANSSGAPIDTWTNVFFDMCQLSGEPCVKLRVTTSSLWYMGDNAYFAFDNVQIEQLQEADIEPVAILLPNTGACSGALGATSTVAVLIENNSCRPISNFPITLEVTGPHATTLNEIVSATVPRFGRLIYTFSGTVNLSGTGVYTFTATTNYALDEIPSNDTYTETRLSNQKINTFPSVTTFNTGNEHWVSRTTNASRAFLTKYDPPYLGGGGTNGKGWYLDVKENGSLGDVWVESPNYDFTSLSSPILSLDVKYQLGLSSYNRLIVQYSTNGGTTWTTLGTSADPWWYNYSTTGWANNFTSPVSEWVQMKHHLCMLAGQACVKFRVLTQSLWYSNDHARFIFDNFTIQNGTDVSLTAFVSPVQNGCMFSPDQPVTVRLYNMGCTAVTNIPVTCEVTGMTTATLVGVVPSIPATSYVDYTFASTADMSAVGMYYFDASLTFAGDLFVDNNSISTAVNVNYEKINTFPYLEDFSTGPNTWTFGKSLATDSTRRFVFGQASYLSGVEGQGDGWYLEVDNNGSLGEVWVESPVFDFSAITKPVLSFDIKHRLGSGTSYNRVRVEYSLNGGTTWTVLGTGPDPSWYSTTAGWANSSAAPVDGWQSVAQELCLLSGEPCVKFRIATSSLWYNGNNAYFMFDNVAITNGEPDDIEPVAITLPQSGTCGNFSATETVQVLIQNNTCRPITNFPITLTVTGPIGSVQTQTVLATVPRFGRLLYNFPTTINMSTAGVYTLAVQTNLASDGHTANDLHVETRNANTRIDAFPYVQNFTTGTNDGWVSRTTNASRAFLLDTIPYLGGSEGKGEGWFLDVRTNGSLGDIWVESPVFDFSSIVNPALSFDIKHRLGLSSYNQVRVEYSINGGTTWVLLGSAASPEWYTSTHGGGSWANSSASPQSEWTRVRHNLCALVGQACVKFRVRTNSLWYSGQDAYFAFDSVRIETATDVAAQLHLAPLNNNCLFPNGQQITVRVFNSGCNALTNVPISCQVTGAITASLTGLVPSIPAGGFTDYSFTTLVDMTAVGDYTFTTVVSEPTDVVAANDTIVHTVSVLQPIIDSYPYLADFNGSEMYWIAKRTVATSTSRAFIHGALPYLGGAEGFGDSWYAQVSTNGSLGEIMVESPVFDLSNTLNPVLSFDIKHRLGSGTSYNRVRVEYTLNGGTTWTQLGTGPLDDWYNTANGWANSSAAPVDEWETVFYKLCNLAGSACVKFRITTNSLWYNENNAYFAFDNVKITDTPLDVAVNMVYGCHDTSYPIAVNVENVHWCATTTHTGNKTIGGTASASTTYSGTSANNVFDGNLATFWGNTASLPSWVEYQFASPEVINQYEIFPFGWGSEIYNPKSWTFEAYNGTTWVALHTVVDGLLTLNQWSSFHFTNETPYQRYRIYITTCEGSSYANIGEMRMMYATPILLETLTLNYDINGLLGAQFFSGLSVPVGGDTTLLLTGLTVPDASSDVTVWSAMPNGLADHVNFNDTVFANVNIWPNCNDHCTNATPLGLGTTAAAQTSYATPNPDEDPTFGGCGLITVENTVWYYFETGADILSDVTITIDSTVCTPSSTGIQVSILELTGVACDTSGWNEIYCSSTGTLTDIVYGPVELNPNATYYIAIDGYANNNCDFNITLEGNVIALPVNLVQFRAVCHTDFAQLTWQTVGEQNSAYFSVERSIDGKYFTEIGTVKAAGNSSSLLHYSFADGQLPLATHIYYRIRQVDASGASYYSAVVKLQGCTQAWTAQISPNPADEQFKLVLDTKEASGNAQMRLYDALGQSHWSKQTFIENNTQWSFVVDVSHLPTGVYFLEILLNDQVQVLKVSIY